MSTSTIEKSCMNCVHTMATRGYTVFGSEPEDCDCTCIGLSDVEYNKMYDPVSDMSYPWIEIAKNCSHWEHDDR